MALPFRGLRAFLEKECSTHLLSLWSPAYSMYIGPVACAWAARGSFPILVVYHRAFNIRKDNPRPHTGDAENLGVHMIPPHISDFWTLRGATNISLGRSERCQHGAFSGVGAIVALFLPAECPVGVGMWGIFGKPLKRAIRNTSGLHAVLTIWLRSSSALDSVCVACCLFLSTGSHHVRIQIHAPGLNETASALIGKLYRCSTGAGHLFIHIDGCCSEFLNWTFCKLFDKLVQWRWFHRIL